MKKWRVKNLKFYQIFHILKKNLAGLQIRLNFLASDELKVRLNFLRNEKMASDLLLISSNFLRTEKKFSRPNKVL